MATPSKRPAWEDPVLAALEAAPLDDEPETADERAALERARADVRAGRTVSTAELRRILEL